ncbi:MAG: hypothetical protein OIF51_20800 [Cellvibrionaceae bacterium]|nr:hypothetical protein [Cellvibrionaceae bacterium]
MKTTHLSFAQHFLMQLAWCVFVSPKPTRFAVYKLLKWTILKTRLAQMKQSISRSFSTIDDAKAESLAKLSASYQAAGLINCLEIPDYTVEIVNNTRHSDLTGVLSSQASVFASVHLGFPDLTSYVLNQYGAKTSTIIGKGKKSPLSNALACKLLNKLGIPFIQKGSNTFFSLNNEIKQGRSVIVHSDLREKGGQKTLFLGRPTDVPATAAALATLSKAPLYFCYTVKDSALSKHCKLYICEIPMADPKLKKAEAIASLTEKIVEEMQWAISLYPEQWFWSYNRFKEKLE